MLLRNWEFCTNQCNESQTLCKCTQAVLPYFPHCSSSGGGTGIEAVLCIYLRGLKGFLHNFHLWCPIWVKYDAHKTILQFRVSCTSAQAWSSFSFASKWNYIYVRTVQPYSIFSKETTLSRSTPSAVFSCPCWVQFVLSGHRGDRGHCGIVWYACKNFYCIVSSKYMTDTHSYSEH
jgi:hypothetical protein